MKPSEEFYLRSLTGKNGPAEREFAARALKYGLLLSDLGREFRLNYETWRVAGLIPGTYSKQVICLNGAGRAARFNPLKVAQLLNG